MSILRFFLVRCETRMVRPCLNRGDDESRGRLHSIRVKVLNLFCVMLLMLFDHHQEYLARWSLIHFFQGDGVRLSAVVALGQHDLAVADDHLAGEVPDPRVVDQRIVSPYATLGFGT